MSFPFAFGTQVAAIMDVLTKAAVAEITQLVEEGTVLLRLEVQRRDTEIQELQSSLKTMEAELCQAQEAAARRATEEEGEQTAGSLILPRDQTKDHEEGAVFPELKPADLLCEGFSGMDESHNTSPAVKREPEAELHVTETTNHTAAEAELADDCLTVPIKVEERVHPVSMENTSSVRRDSRPAVLQDEFVQPASLWAGPLTALPQSSTAGQSNGEHGNKYTISLKGKRLTNVKLFICSVCNRGFTYLSQLEHHKTTYHTLKPFRCLDCGKFFTQKTRLKTHQRVHTGERPFSCKICGKMFSRRDNCLRHERFHSRANC
ncbi:zinc finger protein 568 isoform X2 [Kryptolebias marmoratus]|uniref:zinc finger protein 568 isoform X2 n=1 Tax=Kryptolebias marmoratus TaxID=37003 RepID=UPI0018ACB3D6|nr:zinc finger protein 568 isoform X2 [Kryptolebias marmoratus]